MILFEELVSLRDFLSRFLRGCLLGDSYASSVEKKSIELHTARINFGQSATRHPEYVSLQLKICKHFKIVNQNRKLTESVTNPSKKVKQSYKRLCFDSLSFDYLYFFFQEFYLGYKKGIKTLPSNIRKVFNVITLAFWFMDDGAYKSYQSKGLYFETQRFSIYEVFVLCDILRRKYKILCWPRGPANNNINSYEIYVSGNYNHVLQNLIGDYIIDEIKSQKWPSLKSKDTQNRSPHNIRPTQKGRYRKEITTLKGTNQVIITEKILDSKLKNVKWKRSLKISENYDHYWLETYNKSLPLKNNKLFKYWH